MNDSKLVHGINAEVSNKVYHGDKSFLSSSNLKLLLKDPNQFYKEVILGDYESVDNPNFDIGSYVHAALLEPHKITEEFAMFDGWKKYGNAWEQFKEEHKGKIILSKPQLFKCNQYVSSTVQRKEAQFLLKHGLPEHTMTSKILDVPVKVRADYINIEAGYIVDVKTTSHESGIDIFRQTSSHYYYDLSAALYCQVAHDNYKKLFDFYFIVISKNDLQCHVYKASSNFLIQGHALVNKALVKYKKCLETGDWTRDPATVILPHFGDYEILEV